MTLPPPSPIDEPTGAPTRDEVAAGDDEFDGIAGDPEQPIATPMTKIERVQGESRRAILLGNLCGLRRVVRFIWKLKNEESNFEENDNQFRD